MKRILLIVLFVCLIAVPTAMAQSPTPTMAGIQGGHLIFFYAGSDPVIVDSEGVYYYNLKWSSDGQHLAYLRADANYNWQLVMTNIVGNTPLVLVESYTRGVPDFSWTDDNRLLYAKFDPTFQPTGPESMLNVYRRIPSPAEAEELLATVPYGVGCGGGTSFPGDGIYWQELGDFGTRSTLELTPSGILYSRNCTNVATALYDLNTGTLTDFGSLGNVGLSPDRTQVAGVSFDEMRNPLNQVTIIDLTTLARTEIPTQAPPDNVLWSSTNSILYSSHSPSGEIQLPEEMANMMGNPVLPLYQSEVYFLNPTTGTQQQFLSQPGYRIGRLVATGNPNTILATLVPNGDVWVAAMQQGGPQDPLSLFLPLIYYVTGTDSGGASSTSGEIIQQVAPHPSLNAQ